MAKVFELHFNPGQAKKEKTIFDTFCFVPQTKSEAQLGSLYLLGEMKNTLPPNEELLSELAEIIKNGYYACSCTKTESFEGGEDCLKAALEKANEFLVNRSLHLNLAVLSLSPDFSIHLSKKGDLKILIFTQGEVFDIGDSFNVASTTAKTFPNLVEGKLAQGDKIMVLTKEIFQPFEEQGIVQTLAGITKAKELKKFFKKKKNILREIFGAGLLILVTKQKRKIYLELSRVSVSKISQKIAPQSPFLQTKLTKGLLSILILALLLLLGYLLF